MSGDYSRRTFDPRDHYSAVLMQQGRVQLDADWNEWVDQVGRRVRAEAVDTLGRCTVPIETPDGFRIDAVAGDLEIHPGRMYVDGLLAENHGAAEDAAAGVSAAFDPVLDEVHTVLADGSRAPVTYRDQPYRPKLQDPLVDPLPDGGPHLVYLDVWQREVTYLEDPELVEKAVGIDTTTRRQTVWQVKVHGNIGPGVDCSTPDDQIPGWSTKIAPAAGRLTTGTVPVDPNDDPCVLPPEGGYRGLENHLYRVEIHKGSADANGPTFKWSRYNGSIQTAVTSIQSATEIQVAEVAKDAELGFRDGDWIEVLDDWAELEGEPGQIVQINVADKNTLTITLNSALDLTVMGATPAELGNRHARIRRWEPGEVDDGAGGTDLLAEIPVPAMGTPFVLEHGVQVTFELEPAGGTFRTGDYWVFAARTVDGSLEILDRAPPCGIHHHYCRLAIVDFPDAETDCRNLWPPDFGDESCACTVCISADEHNQGTRTLQWAIDQVKGVGGTVCLDVGVYQLRAETLQVGNAKSVRIRGQGCKTVLNHLGPGRVMRVNKSENVVVENLNMVSTVTDDSASPVITVKDSSAVTLQRLGVLQVASRPAGSVAVGLAGSLIDLKIRECLLVAGVGIANRGKRGGNASTLNTAGLRIGDNVFFCNHKGLSLENESFQSRETLVERNYLYRCSRGALVALGWVDRQSGMDLRQNEIHAHGPGIVVGVDGCRVTENNISAFKDGSGAEGILVMDGLVAGIDHCQLMSNRILDVAGTGIAVQTSVNSIMIKNNVIDGVGGAGIEVDRGARVELASIENNHLLDIGAASNDPEVNIIGISVANAGTVQIGTNLIQGLGKNSLQNPFRWGVLANSCERVRIQSNEIIDLGPDGDSLGLTVGIMVAGSFEGVDISQNLVRSAVTDGAPRWLGVWIQGTKRSSKSALAQVRQVSYMQVSTYTTLAFDDSNAVTVSANRVTQVQRRLENVTMRGNQLEYRGSTGQAAHMVVAVLGSVMASNNQCVMPATKTDVVQLAGATLVVSSNHIEGPVELQHWSGKSSYTVLGNLYKTSIKVNGAALPAKWADLNEALV